MYQNCAARAKLLLAVRVDGWIHLQHTHIAVASAPWSVLLFSSFNVIQRVRNSTGRCEGYHDTRMLQTMKNYCCLRPRGCFDSQILEDKAEHNFKHGVILLNSWSRWLFVLFSQCRKYEITQGNIVFYAPSNQTKVANTVEPPVTKRPLKMQRIIAHKNKATGVSISRRGPGLDTKHRLEIKDQVQKVGYELYFKLCSTQAKTREADYGLA